MINCSQKVHWLSILFYLQNFVLFVVEYVCQLCKEWLGDDIEELMDHCKSCAAATRPDKSFYYTCFQCDYHTYDRTAMRRHTRSHMNIKAYSCPQCDYSSNTKQNVLRHCKRRHKESTNLSVVSLFE
uniref:RE1-silencing transcription factor n=1 Tax=Cacopsylla melanoneura TaxID=428564 RepID=A0A8D8VPI0_9HEMI